MTNLNQKMNNNLYLFTIIEIKIGRNRRMTLTQNKREVGCRVRKCAGSIYALPQCTKSVLRVSNTLASTLRSELRFFYTLR